MEPVSAKSKVFTKKENGELSLEDIAAVVERDIKGQHNMAARIAKGDMTVVQDLVAAAIYRAVMRRGVSRERALKATQELLFITDIKVVF